MSTCAVFGCSNNQTKNKNKSFFRLPTTPEIKKAWLSAINIKEGNLPHKIVVCSGYFDEQCFDCSWRLQNERYCCEKKTYHGRNYSEKKTYQGRNSNNFTS